MTVIAYNNGIVWQGKINDILACLEAAPGDMFLSEYIQARLH